jgi:hypothetical protein
MKWWQHAFAFICLLAPMSRTAAQCTAWNGFQSPFRYAASADETLRVHDVDGDGVPDIIVSGNHVDELAAFSLLRNRGDGTFENERLIATGFGEEIEDVGDLNDDGIADIVASDYWANGIVVGGVPYGTATHGGPSRIVDFDHDGIPDVVSFSFGSGNPVRVHFFRGNGNGTLAPKVTFETDLANATLPSLRMLNGNLEILVGERSGFLGILRYSGGDVTVTRIAAGTSFDLSSTFADVNGDGVEDIIATDQSSSDSESIFVRLANADGTFRDAHRIALRRHVAFPVGVQAADVDGDGNPDIVVRDFQSSNIYVFRGDGTGSFAEGMAFDAGSPVNSFAIADINGDGHPDLVSANSDHTVSVFLNRGGCRNARRRAVRR